MVIDLAEAERATEIVKAATRHEDLADLNPAHAMYVFCQNLLSVMSGPILELPSMSALAKIINWSKKEYLPEGMPNSPLTASYFWLWAFYDASVGRSRETFGSCVQALAEVIPMDPEFLRLVGLLQDSRMGLYVHEGTAGVRVFLRELITGEKVNAIVPAGYLGKEGEVWYARVLPPPMSVLDYQILMATPYVSIRPGEQGWNRFLKQTLPRTRRKDPRQAYEHLMRYGLGLNYWNEWVFCAHAGGNREVIFLDGAPSALQRRREGT